MAFGVWDILVSKRWSWFNREHGVSVRLSGDLELKQGILY